MYWEKLKDLGFKDLANNGMALRKMLPSSDWEVCWYKHRKDLMFQTRESGMTMRLKGVHTVGDLRNWWRLMTNEELKV